MKAAILPPLEDHPDHLLSLALGRDRADTRIRIDGLDDMFRSYVEQWLAYLRSEGKAARTLNTYAESLRLLGQFLQRMGLPTDPQQIERRHIQAFMHELLETVDAATGRPKWSKATAANRFRACQQFFRWLVEVQDELDLSPMAKLHPPKLDDIRPPVIPLDGLKALLATCGQRRDFRDARDYAILLTLIDSGMRLSECTNILQADVDAQLGRIRIMGKGRKERIIQLGATAVNAILAYQRRYRSVHPWARRCGNLWLGPKGPLTESGIYQLVVDRGQAAGLGKINPHQFRHTSSHLGKVMGMRDEDLMYKHGWSTTAMLRKYGASAAEERAQEAQRRHSIGDQLLGRT